VDGAAMQQAMRVLHAEFFPAGSDA
jgi:hypothetical protein